MLRKLSSANYPYKVSPVLLPPLAVLCMPIIKGKFFHLLSCAEMSPVIVSPHSKIQRTFSINFFSAHSELSPTLCKLFYTHPKTSPACISL